MIALDLVLGTEGRSAESVAEKAAVVTYRPLRRTLQDQIRLVKQLYDARSKYVHEGKPFPIGDIIQAEQVAAEVLWSLLTVSGSGTLSNTSEWLRKINYLAAAIKDGRVLPEAEFAALGIVGTEVTRTPPNRVPRGSDRTDAALIMTLYHGRIRDLLANAQPYHDAYSKARRLAARASISISGRSRQGGRLQRCPTLSASTRRWRHGACTAWEKEAQRCSRSTSLPVASKAWNG